MCVLLSPVQHKIIDAAIHADLAQGNTKYPARMRRYYIAARVPPCFAVTHYAETP